MRSFFCLHRSLKSHCSIIQNWWILKDFCKKTFQMQWFWEFLSNWQVRGYHKWPIANLVHIILRLPIFSSLFYFAAIVNVQSFFQNLMFFFLIFFREQPIFTCKAHVFHINPKTKRSWLPASSAAVNVSFFYDSSRALYRIISVEGTKVSKLLLFFYHFSCTIIVGCHTFGPKPIWSPDFRSPSSCPPGQKMVPNKFGPHEQMVLYQFGPRTSGSPQPVPLDK